MLTLKATSISTNLATENHQNITFSIDFNKKKLTASAVQCETIHQRLQSWLDHPLVGASLQQSRAGQATKEKVFISKKTMEIIVGFTQWLKTLPKPGLSELYSALLLTYYLDDINLLNQQLKKQHFGIVADYIVEFYEKQENIEIHNQQAWFQLFFKAWDWALIHVEKDIQAYCMGACFKAQALTLQENKTLNQRQYQLLVQLHQQITVRDKKSLNYSIWYQLLYRGLTKRTQERDFNLLCDCGFLQITGKNTFEVNSD